MDDDKGAWIVAGAEKGERLLDGLRYMHNIDGEGGGDNEGYLDSLESQVRADQILLAHVRSGQKRPGPGVTYPYTDGDTLVLGPECFISDDRSVASIGGRNYVLQDTVGPMRTQGWMDAVEELERYAGQDGAHGSSPALRDAAEWLRSRVPERESEDRVLDPDAPGHCPLCGSPDPRRHPATSFEGEVQPCPDRWHVPFGVVVGVPEGGDTAHCPRCGSADPGRVNAVRIEGGVVPCPDAWHQRPPLPYADLAAEVMRPGGLPPSDAQREQAARAELAQRELHRARALDDELDPMSLLEALRNEEGHKVRNKAYNAAWVDACDYLERVISDRMAHPLMKAMPRPFGEPLSGAEAIADAELGPICGKVMIGEGTDSWDPCCELPEGHGGSCWSSSAHSQHRLPLKRLARVEDKEGDKGTVLRHVDARIVALEWDCRPGHMARVPVMRLTELEDTTMDDAEGQGRR